MLAQDPPDRRLVRLDDAVVAREARGLLGDHAEARSVMIAARQQRGARRRAERRRMDAGEAQPLLGELVHRRSRDHAAEGARHAETRIVGDDHEHVRRVFRRHDARRPPGRRLKRLLPDLAPEGGRRRRQLAAVDGGARAGRAQRARHLLRRRAAQGGEGRDRRECDCCSEP